MTNAVRRPPERAGWVRLPWAVLCGAGVVAAFVACAASAMTVPPAAMPGPYPVACSNVEQDFSRLAGGESPEVYWEGQPRGDGSSRFVTDLLVAPAEAFAHAIAIPDNRDLFGRYRGGSYTTAMLVCYPTTASNPRPDYVLPDGRRVPHMQRSGELPVFTDSDARLPLLLFSHGLGGSPLGSGYLDFIVLFASHGYVVAAPFHGDPRFSQVKLENAGDVIAALFDFDKFVAMQAVRPLAMVSALDTLLASSAWSTDVDAARIGGFGASLGGETMLLLGGAALTTSIGLSSTRVLSEPRLRAAVGYVPYFGQPILPAFGRGQRGVDGVALPFLAISGSADVVAPLAETEDAMVRLASTRELVVLRGTQHGIVAADVPDIFTWSISFLDGHVAGDRVARGRFAATDKVDGGNDDYTILDYSAPAPAAAGEVAIVEYAAAAPERYFVTGNPVQVALLDAGGAPGWGRSGFAFNAAVPDAATAASACHFFGTLPGRRNTRFYDLDAVTCELVRSGPDGTWDDVAFAADAPQGGACAEGGIPVRRLYNGAAGSAANHRFLSSRSEAAVMTGKGWIDQGVAFCARP